MMTIADDRVTITVHARPADAEHIMRALVSLMRNIDENHAAHTDLFYLGMLLDAMLPEERQLECMHPAAA